jgi:hypothetical protein
MTRFTHRLRTLMPLIYMLLTLLCDGLRFLYLCLRPSPALAAENLFLRSGLPMGYSSSWASVSPPARCVNICRAPVIAVQNQVCHLNAGGPLCATTPRWRVL